MLNDLELDQAIFCMTNMGPRISVNDLDVTTKDDLKLGSTLGAGLSIMLKS